MSWQDYVNSFLGTGIFNQSYVIGQDAQVYGASHQLPAVYELEVTNDDFSTGKEQVNEIALLVEAMNNEGKVTSKSGVRIHGQKYIPTAYDEEKDLINLANEHGGCILAKTVKCILVNVYPKPEGGLKEVTPKAMEEVEKIQQMLIQYDC